MERRTKIVCTLGPSSSDEETIGSLAEAGMDIARLNLSHGTHEDHAHLIEMVRKCASRVGRRIPILMDLQGPKIRVGEIPDGPIYLDRGAEVCLTGEPIDSSSAELMFVDYPTLHADVSVGRRILIDDGHIELTVTRIEGKRVYTNVTVGGIVTSKKGVNLPNIRTSTPALTPKDLADLAFGLEQEVDIVALSFVREAEDVQNLLDRLGTSRDRPFVIAKIEKPEAVEHFAAILKKADGIMVARGDLGIEMKLAEVPRTQKRIIRECMKAAKPVITATQMLESMMGNPRPTRAEVSDVANAVIDGSDAVMLSGETAAGSYPVRAVEVMANVIEEAERSAVFSPSEGKRDSKSISDAISRTANDIAAKVGARAIACMTASGATARAIASHRPAVPVYAFTDDRRVVGQIALTWGTKGFYIPFETDTDDGISKLHAKLIEYELAEPGDLVVVTAGMPLPAKGRSNTVHVGKL